MSGPPRRAADGTDRKAPCVRDFLHTGPFCQDRWERSACGCGGRISGKKEEQSRNAAGTRAEDRYGTEDSSGNRPVRPERCEVEQGIFSVKLCEMEQEYGRLQSRIQLCQEPGS